MTPILSLPAAAFPIDAPFGANALCFWSMGGGRVRIQARDPVYRAALRRMSGFRRVAYAVTRGYMEVFEGSSRPGRTARVVAKLLSSPPSHTDLAREVVPVKARKALISARGIQVAPGRPLPV